MYEQRGYSRRWIDKPAQRFGDIGDRRMVPPRRTYRAEDYREKNHHQRA